MNPKTTAPENFLPESDTRVLEGYERDFTQKERAEFDALSDAMQAAVHAQVNPENIDESRREYHQRQAVGAATVGAVEVLADETLDPENVDDIKKISEAVLGYRKFAKDHMTRADFTLAA